MAQRKHPKATQTSRLYSQQQRHSLAGTSPCPDCNRVDRRFSTSQTTLSRHQKTVAHHEKKPACFPHAHSRCLSSPSYAASTTKPLTEYASRRNPSPFPIKPTTRTRCISRTPRRIWHTQFTAILTATQSTLRLYWRTRMA